MSTIRDIADRAGVSVSTASLALNGDARVRPATRERVLEAARELSYHPTHAAKSLSSGRAYAINVVNLAMPTDLASGFFTRFVRGVHDAAEAARYTVTLSILGSRAEAGSVLERLVRERRTDGLVLMNPSEHERLLGRLQAQQVPHVLLGRSSGNELLSVDSDNVRLAFDATAHLLEQGCEALLLLAGPPHHTFTQERATGFRRALEQAGRGDVDRAVLFFEGGAEAARRVVEERLDGGAPFDGVVAVSDVLAIGALRALNERKIAVPARVALVGMNDDDLCEYVRPRLTSVNLDAYRLGREAAELLLEAIDNPPDAPVRRLIDHRLAVRESSSRKGVTA